MPYVTPKKDRGEVVESATPSNIETLTSEIQVARQTDVASLMDDHAVNFVSDLGYDPLTSQYLDEILDELYSGSTEEARAAIAKDGFVINGKGSYSSFVQGYARIYLADMPVFITADMVLEAFFRSHYKILQELERQELQPRLGHFLDGLRRALGDRRAEWAPEVASDLNVFLGVAISLLNGSVDGREPEGVADFYAAALAAKGVKKGVLFGVERDFDFTQFEPRGHYAGDESLERYFRAMMWLGRTDVRLLETLPDGSRVLRRRGVESMVGLRELLDSPLYDEYRAIDDILTAFVGEHDYMALQEVDAFLKALGSPNRLDDVSDVELSAALLQGQFGEQRIASQLLRAMPDNGPLPLSSSFALFGQRYTVDSHVFSNLVYDRLPQRVVPDPLDIAFAALGNDQALSYLEDELNEEEEYAGELAAVRLLVDSHSSESWESSLYTSWLGALRALSPKTTLVAQAERQPGSSELLPSVARTEAWGRRLLQTQLGSWAQLRHNNVLYVKESYTTNALCEYPDAYVEPYPEFFEAVVGLAERGANLFQSLDLQGAFSDAVVDYFESVAHINTRLARMAHAQRTGSAHDEKDLAFINRGISYETGCDGTVLEHYGWYRELHFDPLDAVKVDPVITGVHTDIGGALPVERDPSVLHVGTGLPRLLVMTVDSCEGPRAYAGVVFDYRESKEPGLTRLTDEEWKDRIYAETKAEPPSWLAPVVATQ